MLPKSRPLVISALLISVAVLIAAGFLSHSSIRQLTEARQQTEISKDSLLELEATVSTLLDAETGQRGYLLTGSRAYLLPYTEALSAIHVHLGALQSLAAGRPALERDLAELRLASGAKLAELAQTIRLNDGGEHAVALRLVMSGAGRKSMDQIRLITDRMAHETSVDYASNVQNERHALELTLASVWATAVLAVALLGLLYLVVQRDGAQLRASERQLAVTLRSIGDGVIATDAAGLIVLMNPVAESLTGWSATLARGRSLDEVFRIINEQSRVVIESPVAKVLRAGMVVGLANHTLLVRRDGVETPIADSGAPILTDAKEVLGVVLVFRDASQERDVEHAMREADRRKDEFLAILSHELRNPLAPIRQAVAVIRSPAATEPQVRWSVEVIERQVRNISRLLDDLLEVSRITRGTLEIRKSLVAISKVLDEAIEIARPLIDSKHHELTVDCAIGLTLYADPLRLAQVVANLLMNAAKYTEPHGHIWLTAGADAAMAVITVRDNGVGIGAGMLTRIFEMFVQADGSRDRAEGGLGIGLALARGLIDLHGGTIEVRSGGLGHGSEFVVRLPLSAPAELPGSTDRAESADSADITSFLVADDNSDAAESLAMLLRLRGHEVQVVNDGAAALELLASMRPRFALLDIGMPNMDGHQLAGRIRAAPWGENMTLVAITGWGQDSDRNAALAAGFDYHFVKPVDIDAILGTLLTNRRGSDAAQPA
jgi:PAS domain S-box-containing protein